MVKDLIRLRADVHARGSNGATVLWQASYFGQYEIADFFLASGVDLELAAQSQDDLDLSFTPLHAAANAGHVNMVARLLKAKANLHVDSGRDTRPLEDAIVQGHADVVQLLVASSADVYRQRQHSADVVKPEGNTQNKQKKMASVRSFVNVCVEENRCQAVSQDSSSSNSKLVRCIDIVFASDNPVLILGVAMGLKKSPPLLNKLSAADLIRFLGAPGDAPLHILDAVFRSYPMMFWQNESGKLRRISMRAAFVDTAKGMNLAEGPHRDEVLQLFNSKTALPSSIQDFVGVLAPRKLSGGRGMFVPVTFTMCHIPNAHHDIDVLMALAHSPQPDIFSEPGSQAILNFAWEKEKLSAKIGMVMAFVEVMNLVAINFILNESKRLPSRELSSLSLTIANLLAIAVLAIVTCNKLVEILGHLTHGLRSGSAMFWLFDAIVLSLTGLVNVWTWNLGLEAKSEFSFNIALGILVFIKWMRLLMSLRLIESIGMRILPITTTMWDVGPFCAVLAVYLIGSANMYYSLGIHSFPRSFLIIYRMVVLGDVDLNEMENIWDSNMELVDAGRNHSIIMQSVPESTEYYYVVRAFMLFISFVMGLSMMNLFIAMLCLSYANAMEVATKAFMKSRALAMIDHFAYRSGVRTLKKTFRMLFPRRTRKAATIEVECSEVEEDQDHTKSVFLWYCSRKE
eukprot:TRINITY_DN23808_c0_g1_i2.p1 TRINITY_DN23808_c0_g1~~TRINITY_DN23808_c0_g1_i2.p1  ORF type:complete len:684 (-),score=57.86 TRINITY_DN23808_c0_g1_i2:408-2459(-)